ncbi:MAG: 2-C-methyl-D-erythritol 2,4-cyclodiphosphate synthase [Candidatus Cloacimonadia bacterium]
MRIGFGYDVHRLVPNRKLILGGVVIPFELGLAGHSDADVLTHSIIDALLGALALGDIGKLFPDSDPKYKDVDSRLLLREVNELIVEKGYRVGNIDSTICLQRPKIAPYIDDMRANLASDLKIDLSAISVKATTEEGLGISGSESGVVCYATVLLKEF